MTADRATQVPLADRQLEVILTALDAGYYDVPREATLTDVVSELSVTKSTCSDILHRTESTITRWFTDEYVGNCARNL
ncbi:helix-turn-helix domain-containing protein (plasmid) [Haloterrigena salifodinae]|uniref:Helix-turn-helix domain-containing protein n=1 Tax=Haloterrigena salifodinae TaxID=2675099 RepID=A0A8T8E821_9EURY|nr:helix-turn-helix domain-containing protein [Haloterrigena salifodinae]QRV17767.1 helix-turn-helix domain-containing protein [Haloterrigena salifodinae]